MKEAVMKASAIPAAGLGQKRKKLICKLLWYVLVCLLAVIFIIPVYWMVLMSFKPLSEMYVVPIPWFPRPPFQISNYVEAWQNYPFPTYFKNTITVVLLTTVGNVFSATLTAYGFARIKFPGRNVLFVILISSMMLPFQVKTIPLFQMYKLAGWLDTLLPLIVPAFFAAATPFYVFLMRQFFLSIPEDLSAAARIDGCGSFRIFRSIFLPLTKPAIVTVCLFSFMDNWNDFFLPLIFINSNENKTLSLGLAGMTGQYVSEWHIIMAASVITVLPCVIVFLFAQKYFVEGIAVSGLKG